MSRSSVRSSILVAFMFIVSLSSAGENVSMPDLTKVTNDSLWSISNRVVSIATENGMSVANMNAQPGDGILWLKGSDFRNGVIKVDIRGNNQPGRSFVGIAFRGVDKETYDVVYFRPFNFKGEDPVRRGHAVQYISHPEYPWYRLREEHPEQYENPVKPVPDPNSFFHAKIVVAKPNVSVYVNDGADPCLEIEELSAREGGWIGFWTGNNSSGSFANLWIYPSSE